MFCSAAVHMPKSTCWKGNSCISCYSCFDQGSESPSPTSSGNTMRSDTLPHFLSWTVHISAGSTSSASPAERSVLGCAVEQMPASDRPRLESSSVTVSRKANGQHSKPVAWCLSDSSAMSMFHTVTTLEYWLKHSVVQCMWR